MPEAPHLFPEACRNLFRNRYLADETTGSSVEGADDSKWSRACFFFFVVPAAAIVRGDSTGDAVFVSTIQGQFAEELGELHDGSISLFVTLPVFRALLVTERCLATLTRFESAIGEHLAYLDGILSDVFVRRNRADGDLTRSLVQSLSIIRTQLPSEERDEEILSVLEQAQLFLMGSCGFALRFARQAGVTRSVRVLEESMARIAALALYLPARPSAPRRDVKHADAVA